MNIRIDADLATKIREIADHNGLSYQRYVNNLLEKALELETACQHLDLMSYTEDGIRYKACRNCKEIWNMGTDIYSI
jgi:hypothetical protein